MLLEPNKLMKVLTFAFTLKVFSSTDMPKPEQISTFIPRQTLLFAKFCYFHCGQAHFVSARLEIRHFSELLSLFTMFRQCSSDGLSEQLVQRNDVRGSFTCSALPRPPPPPCLSSHSPLHWPLSSLHSSSSSFHRWAHSACSISQQPRCVGVIPTVPGGAVAGPPTRFHLPLLAPHSGNLHTHPLLAPSPPPHLDHCLSPLHWNHSPLHPTDAPRCPRSFSQLQLIFVPLLVKCAGWCQLMFGFESLSVFVNSCRLFFNVYM